MTRRSRRASSAPQRVGSDEGLTSSRPTAETSGQEPEAATPTEAEAGAKVGGRHTPRRAEQTKDDTDEGWGEPGDDDASARWLRENRPPHWS
ncbi:hypothetical protein GCM10022415_06640 [Knoellia locipacati]|uniref:Uncharacterized protein n=1 Tax=Knoellia locipacati TaxID=882824 RepID=A0A512SXI3_9MICO|nr:hypothetical protein [Knoellia locipacati]GEQ12615.1 hypothetical protein KLO01_06620 [Knoellia locipacati]